MHDSVMKLGMTIALTDDQRTQGDILEVGSRNVNGTWRDIFEKYATSYTGIDMIEGPDVDMVLNANNLSVALSGNYDFIICTEVLEHCEDWRAVINEMKKMLKPGGLIAITTRSKGFPYHEYPGDFWRYSLDNMKDIFSDFTIISLSDDPDPDSPGVFLVASSNPLGDVELADLSDIVLETP